MGMSQMTAANTTSSNTHEDDSVAQNSNPTGSSIYHQKIILSNDGSQIKGNLGKNEDSGGAKPEIEDNDNLSNVSDASDKDDKNRLGGVGAASNIENKSDATDNSNTNA